MNYYIYGLTSKGNVRSSNEDRILVCKEVVDAGSCFTTLSAPFVAAVCDGVGGENAGEVAAQMCLEKLSELDYRSDTDLKNEILDIHYKIKSRGEGESSSRNMQTTLCMLAVDENGEAVCVNIGDSRMYRYVNAAIRQISTDQSYRQYVYEHGGEGDVARISPRLANAIVSSVGSSTNDPEIEIIPLVTRFGKEPDDMILIVSDGVSDYVSEQQLEIGMGLDLPIAQKLEAIAQLALDNGSTDNISIIGIKPYNSHRELQMLTSENVEKTVNIQELLKETDKLGDILTFDINEIISKPTVTHEPDPLPERPVKREQVQEAETITVSPDRIPVAASEPNEEQESAADESYEELAEAAEEQAGEEYIDNDEEYSQDEEYSDDDEYYDEEDEEYSDDEEYYDEEDEEYSDDEEYYDEEDEEYSDDDEYYDDEDEEYSGDEAYFDDEKAQPSLIEAIEKAKAAKEEKGVDIQPETQTVASESLMQSITEAINEKKHHEIKPVQEAAEEEAPIIEKQAVPETVQQEEPEQEIPEELEKVDVHELGEQALMAVETEADHTAQSIREIEEAENAIPDELIETNAIEQEFMNLLNNAQINHEQEETAQEQAEPEQQVRTDPELHAVELSHQSASSLARLEKLFGKN